MTLEELTNQMHEHAVNVFATFGKKAELIPIVHAETKDGRIGVIGVPWGNQEEKQRQLGVLRAIFKRENVVRYALLAESWAAMYDKGNDLDVPPSEREDRAEIVSIIAADSDGNTRCVAYHIDRDAKGRPSVGDVYHIGDEYETAGQMLNLLEG